MNADNGTPAPSVVGIRPPGRGLQRGLLGIEDRAPADRAPFMRRHAAHAGSIGRTAVDDALSDDDFLGVLQREKRRAERTRAALSIVLCHVSGATAKRQAYPGDATPDEHRLLELLHHVKRETDVLGRIDGGTVAVICPDTDKQGTEKFIRRIERQADGLSFSASAATYPDHLLEHLTDARHRATDFDPLLHEEHGRRGYALKRGIDVVGALAALLIFSPLMLLIAIAIKLSSPGPIIFRQTRLGKNGVPFVFYKFRSMRADVDDAIHRQFVASLIKGQSAGDPATKPVYKMRADPRITGVGRLIRKLSIDELPQLFNVLKGDMSLVGARPPLPYEAAHYRSWHLRRVLSLRPGITGLWQVEGRSKVNFDEMVRMDLRYIRHCSLTLDLKILLKTIVVVIRCDGAT